MQQVSHFIELNQEIIVDPTWPGYIQSSRMTTCTHLAVALISFIYSQTILPAHFICPCKTHNPPPPPPSFFLFF